MQSRLLKIIGWICLSLLVVIGTIILVAIGRGYSYDYQTGRLKINGLAIFASTPSGADIAIDGKSIKRRTPYRTTLEAGDYTVDITKDGYRPWTKRLQINPSEVTWAQYILMLPNQLQQQQWLTASDMKLLATSRDHKNFAFVDGKGEVYGFNASDHKVSKLYTPTAPAAGLPIETVTALAWSGDSSRLLVTTTSDKLYQRIVTANNSRVQKLTEQFGFDLTGLRFNPTNSRELFWLPPEGLRRLNTDSQSLSAVLADKVASYTFGGSGQIVYIQTTPLGQSLFGMDTSGANKRELVQGIVSSPSYSLAFASYKNSDIVAILPSASRTVTLYTNIDSNHTASRVISRSADNISFNTDGRFLNYRNGQRLATFDLEFNRTYNFATAKAPYQSVVWFDTYHLLTVSAGKVTLVEYDGANANDLTDGVMSGQMSFTANQKEVLVAKRQTTGTVELQAIKIKE